MHGRLNLFLCEGELFEGVPCNLEDALSEHRVAPLMQVIGCTVEYVELLSLFLLAVLVDLPLRAIFTEEAYEEHEFKYFQSNVFLVTTLREHSEEILPIEHPLFKEHFDQMQDMVSGLLQLGGALCKYFLRTCTG